MTIAGPRGELGREWNSWKAQVGADDTMALSAFSPDGPQSPDGFLVMGHTVVPN